jgi:multiple sugar transport system ATP-binding protein
VQQVGEPLELYNTPANKFVAGFIGSPAMNFANVTLTGTNGALFAENSGLRIKLPDEVTRRLNGHAERDITLGIRPEDLTVAGATDPADLCFDAAIDVVEQLGSEIILDMKVGEGMMVASVEPTLRVKVHDKLRLAMRPSRLHVFDAKTGAAI